MSQVPPEPQPSTSARPPAEPASSHSRTAARAPIIAAVIAAVAAVVVALINGWFTAGSKNAEQPAAGNAPVAVTPQTSAPAPQSAASTDSGELEPASPAPSVPKAGALRWEGDVTVNQADQQNFDLDPVPPRRVADKVDDDVEVVYGMTSEGGSLADFDDSASLALVKGSAMPGYSTCATAALSQGSSKIDNVRHKSIICVRTSEGRIAAMRVTRVNPFEGMVFHVKVWEGDEQQ